MALDEAAVERTIRPSRFGVVPSWGERPGDALVRAVPARMRQLGGEADGAVDASDASCPPEAEATPAAPVDERPAVGPRPRQRDMRRCRGNPAARPGMDPRRLRRAEAPMFDRITRVIATGGYLGIAP